MQEYTDQNNPQVVNNDLYLNGPQLRAILADPKELYFMGGRRLGKSTEIIAHLTNNRIHDMPRAKFLMMGRSYKQVLTQTLPATAKGWAKRGLIEDVHYVVGKRPPADWDKAYGAPLKDYSHYISFYTGTGFHIGSQDRPGLVNSLTVWGIFADEAKLLLEDRFKEDALPTNSGETNIFKGNPHNRCIVLTSSMPALPEGKWLLDQVKRMDPARIDAILSLAIKLEEERAELNKPENIYFIPRIEAKIKQLTARLNILRIGSVMYEEASTLANVHVLGADYIKNQKPLLKNYFKREILNIASESPEGGFYSQLSARNFYTDFDYTHYERFHFRDVQVNSLGDRDCDKRKPLIIGMDFGPNFNCIVTAQRHDASNTIKIINVHYTTPDEIIDDVVTRWCKYYEYHPTKEIIFHHDHAGNNRTGMTRETFAQRAYNVFKLHKWDITKKTYGGRNPFHHQKYMIWNLSLSGKDPRFPTILINAENCDQLKTSMNAAKAKDKDGVISKDKSSETRKGIPPEDATHISDAADAVIYGEYSPVLRHANVNVPDVGFLG